MSGSGRGGHVFTVDVEEYFHVHAFDGVVKRGEWDELPSRVEEAVRSLLNLLEKVDATATFFVLGWVAERNPELVRTIADHGHEVGSHGWSHRRIDELGRERFREEVRRTRRLLEEITGRPVRGFRAPSFSLVPGTEWALDVLAEEGYRYDSSIYPIWRPGYGYPGAGRGPHVVRTAAAPLLELPVATMDIAGLTLPAGGGAYFRHFPYGVFRRALRQMAGAGAPGVFYIHSWEVDAEQPHLPVPWITRLRHYRNLEATSDRLERLATEFDFGSVEDRFALDGSRDEIEHLNGTDGVDSEPRSY